MDAKYIPEQIQHWDWLNREDHNINSLLIRGEVMDLLESAFKQGRQSGWDEAFEKIKGAFLA